MYILVIKINYCVFLLITYRTPSIKITMSRNGERNTDNTSTELVQHLIRHWKRLGRVSRLCGELLELFIYLLVRSIN